MHLFKKVCNVHVPAVTAHINFIKSHTSACSSTDKFLYTVRLKLSTLTIANIIIQLAKCVKNLNKTITIIVVSKKLKNCLFNSLQIIAFFK